MIQFKILKSTLLIMLTLSILVFSCSQVDQHQQNAELKQHTVEVDGHPIAVWEKSANDATEAILLVHGRTWSALPDFDLQVDGEDLSLMDGLTEAGYTVFAVDLRGYGATPRDETGWNTPDRAAKDLAGVLSWIDSHKDWRIKPHLFGWSFGSTHSQLLAQRHPDLISSVTFFGYWYDNDMTIPADEEGLLPEKTVNTAEAAASDFIIPGSISQKAIDAYVTQALQADPIRVDYNKLNQLNELDPSKVVTPSLIIQGEFDPIAPTDRQLKLYTLLGTSFKSWVTIPDGDHAAFMETPRDYFIFTYVNFLKGISDIKQAN